MNQKSRHNLMRIIASAGTIAATCILCNFILNTTLSPIGSSVLCTTVTMIAVVILLTIIFRLRYVPLPTQTETETTTEKENKRKEEETVMLDVDDKTTTEQTEPQNPQFEA